MGIDKGYFGKTKLDGLHFGGLFAWPAAIHMGNGEAMPVIDERADKDQRAAFLFEGTKLREQRVGIGAAMGQRRADQIGVIADEGGIQHQGKTILGGRPS